MEILAGEIRIAEHLLGIFSDAQQPSNGIGFGWLESLSLRQATAESAFRDHAVDLLCAEHAAMAYIPPKKSNAA